MESKGLGDSIDKFTTATGIKQVVKAVFGEDCGCDQRQETANKFVPYDLNHYKSILSFFKTPKYNKPTNIK